MPKVKEQSLLDEARGHDGRRQRGCDSWPKELVDSSDEVLLAMIAGESGPGFQFALMARRLRVRLAKAGCNPQHEQTVIRYLKDRMEELRRGKAH